MVRMTMLPRRYTLMPKHAQAHDMAPLGLLIERLGPLNNRWREAATPAAKVLTVWDMGDALLSLAPKASDPLLWEIQERSYIKRDVLRYALIVRRSWEEREALADLVRDLRSYTVFREALPFLKGDREDIDEAEFENVVRALRTRNTAVATNYVRGLKSRRIGRKHSKGESVALVLDAATTFTKALERLEADAATGGIAIPAAPSEALVALSQTAMAVATDESIMATPAALEMDTTFSGLSEPLVTAIRGGRASLAAFRRLVGHARLMHAADLLHALRSDEAFAEWQRRHSALPSPRSRLTLVR